MKALSDKVEQFCTFRLAGHLFGVEVARVQEVLRYQQMTRVPLAPKEVQGLINLRGQIVTAIDLRTRLGFPPFPEGTLPMNVVLRTEGSGVSLLVDEIGDVVEVEEVSREAPPDTVTGRTRELLREVYKLDHELLLVLDSTRATHLGTPER